MDPVKPLRNQYLRRAFRTTAIGGCVVVSLTVVAALLDGSMQAWLWVGTTAAAWGMALYAYLTAYRIGWYARAGDENSRTAGTWMAYPVDVDGMPVTAPTIGRMVIDRPSDPLGGRDG